MWHGKRTYRVGSGGVDEVRRKRLGFRWEQVKKLAPGRKWYMYGGVSIEVDAQRQSLTTITGCASFICIPKVEMR